MKDYWGERSESLPSLHCNFVCMYVRTYVCMYHDVMDRHDNLLLGLMILYQLLRTRLFTLLSAWPRKK